MKTLLFALLLISTVSLAQTAKATKSDKIILPEQTEQTIQLTEKQEKSLMDLDNQIKMLQAKQQELLVFIFDAKGFDIEKIKDLKYEKGKFIFIVK